MISNRQILIVRRENAFCKFHTLTMFLVYHDLKQKIRCIDAPYYAFTHRNPPESEEYIWIIQNVYEKSRFFYIGITRWLSLVHPDTRLSPPVFLERSIASMLMRYAAWLVVICLTYWRPVMKVNNDRGKLHSNSLIQLQSTWYILIEK